MKQARFYSDCFVHIVTNVVICKTDSENEYIRFLSSNIGHKCENTIENTFLEMLL